MEPHTQWSLGVIVNCPFPPRLWIFALLFLVPPVLLPRYTDAYLLIASLMNLNCVMGRENLMYCHFKNQLKFSYFFFFLLHLSFLTHFPIHGPWGCYQFCAMNILKINISLCLLLGGAFGVIQGIIRTVSRSSFLYLPIHLLYNYIDTHYIHMRTSDPVYLPQLSYYVCPGVRPDCQAEP